MNKGASKETSEEESEDEEQEEKPAKKSASKSSGDEPAWKTKLVQQLPFLAKFLGGKKSDEDDTSAGSASSEDATDANIKIPTDAAAKKQKIIRAAVAIGALYFVADMFLAGDETAVEEPAAPVAKPGPSKRKLEREKAKAAAEAAAKAKAEEEAKQAAEGGTAPVADPAATASTEPTPVEPAVETPLTEASAPVEGTAPEAPTPTTAEETPAIDGLFGEGPVEGAAPAEGGDATAEGSTPAVTGEGAATDQVAEGTKVPEGDMTDQILKDLEKQIETNKGETPGVGAAYVDPPDYSNLGRGLVYNCQGKHWACIDGPSFKICQQNNSALKGQGKAKECHPDSVYQTESACAWVQRQKIVGNTKTDFCL